MNILDIINKYYPEDNELKDTLLKHSRQVCHKALAVATKHPELHLNQEILENGAMLHDIGIFLTDAPAIHCHGSASYLAHGYLGGQLLRKENMITYARICERHTGTGLTKETIQELHIPIPAQDYLPETLEEQVICYADKFFSKTHLDQEKTIEQATRSLAKFGEEGLQRFIQWTKLFE